MWPQQNRHQARREKAAQFPEILNFLIHRLAPLTLDRPKRTNEPANLCNSLLKRYAIDIRACLKAIGGKEVWQSQAPESCMSLPLHETAMHTLFWLAISHCMCVQTI